MSREGDHKYQLAIYVLHACSWTRDKWRVCTIDMPIEQKLMGAYHLSSHHDLRDSPYRYVSYQQGGFSKLHDLSQPLVKNHATYEAIKLGVYARNTH